jgi:adhesin transport system outer membrane protein
MTRSFLLLLAGSGIALILQSGTAHAESLRDAVQAALGNHPSVEAAIAGEEYSKQERREHVSDLFPQLSTSATGGRMYGDNSTSRGLTTNRGQAYSWLWEGNATLTQPIFDGMETFNRIDAAQARQTSAQYKVADARETLALRAVQSYIAVLQATESVEKINAYRAKITDYQSRIQSMVDEGAADEAEVAQAKNVSLLLDNTLAESKSQLDAAFAGYKEAVGKLPESALQRPAGPDAMILPTPDEALAHAKTNHPVVLAALKEMEAAGYDADAEKGTLFPALDGELSYLKRDQKEEIGGEVEDGRALVRMTWDFSTGGGDLARIRKTKAAYSEKLARSQETMRQIERDINVSYAELERAKKQKELSAERARIMQDLFNANEAQFEGARVRLLQIMQSDNQLFGSQLESMNADYSYLMSQYTVLASTGRLQQALELGDNAYVGSDAVTGQGEVIPVVSSPKAVETKVEPDPEPPIKQIDDDIINKASMKEPIVKAKVQKAAVKQSEEFPQEEVPVAPPVADTMGTDVIEPEAPVVVHPAVHKAPTIGDERVYPDLSE